MEVPTRYWICSRNISLSYQGGYVMNYSKYATSVIGLILTMTFFISPTSMMAMEHNEIPSSSENTITPSLYAEDDFPGSMDQNNRVYYSPSIGPGGNVDAEISVTLLPGERVFMTYEFYSWSTEKWTPVVTEIIDGNQGGFLHRILPLSPNDPIPGLYRITLSSDSTRSISSWIHLEYSAW